MPKLVAVLSHLNEAALAAPIPERLATLLTWGRAVSIEDALWSAGIIAAGFVAGRLLGSLLLKLWAKGAARTDWKFDDSLVKHLGAPIRWLFPVFIVRWLLPLVQIPDDAQASVAQILLVLLVSGVGWIVLRLLNVLEDYVTTELNLRATDNLKARSVYTQVRALRNIARFVVIVLTAGAVLTTFASVRSLGAGLLASTGVAGVILGFAAQKSIATVVSGIHIAIAQPVRVDDVVIVEGEWGRVEEITLTYIVVRIWDLRRLVVPINYFLEKPFQNWTRVSAEMLGTVELHLDYSVPLAELRAELSRILEASEHWDGKVKNIQVTGASEKTMLVRPLMSARDSGAMWDLRCEVREKLIAFVQREYPGALPQHRALVEPPRSSSLGVRSPAT
jgi:small-conductance mechanosensitive channel